MFINDEANDIEKHQQSINYFIDTMKLEQKNSVRKSQQYLLFENLEKELKSIVEAFNKERIMKK